MGFNFHLNLPGPFTYNARLTGRRPVRRSSAAASVSPVTAAEHRAMCEAREAERLHTERMEADRRNFLREAVVKGVSASDAATVAPYELRKSAEAMIEATGILNYNSMYRELTIGQLITIMRNPGKVHTF